MSVSPIRVAFTAQAEHCERLGSPFTARLCRLLAVDIADHPSAVADRLRRWPGDPSHRADAVPLRLAAGLHALVLSGAAPTLAAVYPPNHSGVEEDTLRCAFGDALRAHETHLLRWLESPPQTNEVRRSAPLYLGLVHIAREMGLPMLLSEIGASGGLNLLLDRYEYDFGGSRMGAEDSTIWLAPDWTGTPPSTAPVHIVGRAGCDRRPLDLSRSEDRLRAIAYLWADQCDRIMRTRHAIALSRDAGLRVEQADAADFVERRLLEPYRGAVHVLMHSIVWQYLDETCRNRIREAMEKAGDKATLQRPLAWLAMEDDGSHPGAALTLRLWPGGESRVFARCDFHGRWIAAHDRSRPPTPSPASRS